VEMLVVITIIGLIMGLIGPRVLNYSLNRKSRLQSSASELLKRADRSISCRPLPLDFRKASPPWIQRTPGVAAWNGPYLKEAMCPVILEATLCVSRAGRTRTFMTSCPTDRMVRRGWQRACGDISVENLTSAKNE